MFRTAEDSDAGGRLEQQFPPAAAVLFDPLLGLVLHGNVAGGTGDRFDASVRGQNGNEDVFIDAHFAGRPGEWCGVPNRLAGVDHMLDLALEPGGQFRWIIEFKEIFADRL